MHKQSSVEWLIDKLTFESEEGGRLNSYHDWIDLKEFCEQAKAMHKEEIEEAFANGVDDEYEWHINNEPRTNTEQYYNETYGE